MMKRFGISGFVLAALLSVGVLAGSSAGADVFRSQWANPHAGQDAARDGVRSGRLMSLDAVLRKVQAQVPGRLLDAELQDGRSPVYRIKMLSPDGGVVHVTADARNGQILRVQGR